MFMVPAKGTCQIQQEKQTELSEAGVTELSGV